MILICSLGNLLSEAQGISRDFRQQLCFRGNFGAGKNSVIKFRMAIKPYYFKLMGKFLHGKMGELR